MTERDDLYSHEPARPGSFRFDARVARVFSNMIRRSVPGYGETVRMSGWLASQYLRPGDTLLDLGCSLGAGLLATRAALAPAERDSVQFVGVDNSQAMLERCQQLLTEADLAARTQLIHGDLLDLALPRARVVLLNWTLQFLPPDSRDGLVRRLHDCLVPGGALILSEKVVDPDARSQALAEQLHQAYKRSQGYSELEIAGKRTALEQVLMPETLTRHQQRLSGAGFDPVLVWYRQLNFASMLALRT